MLQSSNLYGNIMRMAVNFVKFDYIGYRIITIKMFQILNGKWIGK